MTKLVAVISQHETLSELSEKKPDTFTSLTQTMIDRLINNSQNPGKMRALQKRIKPYMKTGREVKYENSMKELADKFNSH